MRDDAHGFLDVPLHDLLGQVLDLPVHAILGGRGDTTVEVYDGAIYFDDLDPARTRGGSTSCWTSAAPTRPWAIAASSSRSAGDTAGWVGPRVTAVTSRSPARCVPRYPTATILVDANDGYDVDGICGYLDAVADVGLYWLEEPFPDDADDLAALRRHLDAGQSGDQDRGRRVRSRPGSCCYRSPSGTTWTCC